MILYGYKDLRFSKYHKRFVSPYHNQIWDFGNVIQASCKAMKFKKLDKLWHDPNNVPNEKCNCGIHVSFYLKNVPSRGLFLYDTYYTCLISGFGKYILHEEGFRSEKASLHSLIIPEAYNGLEDVYHHINYAISEAEKLSQLLFIPLITTSDANKLIERSLLYYKNRGELVE